MKSILTFLLLILGAAILSATPYAFADDGSVSVPRLVLKTEASPAVVLPESVVLSKAANLFRKSKSFDVLDMDGKMVLHFDTHSNYWAVFGTPEYREKLKAAAIASKK